MLAGLEGTLLTDASSRVITIAIPAIQHSIRIAAADIELEAVSVPVARHASVSKFRARSFRICLSQKRGKRSKRCTNFRCPILSPSSWRKGGKAQT